MQLWTAKTCTVGSKRITKFALEFCTYNHIIMGNSPATLTQAEL